MEGFFNNLEAVPLGFASQCSELDPSFIIKSLQNAVYKFETEPTDKIVLLAS